MPSVLDRYRGSIRMQVLASATLWISYFAVVYLAGEWMCSAPDRTTTLAGVDALTALVVAATVVTVVAIVAVTISQAPDPGPDADSGDHELRLMAWLLAGLFVIATIVVGIVPLAVGPC